VAQQFDRAFLDELCSLTTTIRTIAKDRAEMLFLKGLLAHKRAMLYFSQPSSRTFLSFSAACQILGIDTEEVRDTSVSSEFKGESKEDSVRTFSSYFDLIIMRSKIAGLAERMAWVLSNSERPIPIVNGGSGRDQHPTQALLDIYTLQRSFEERGGIDGKRIAFVGDLLRGRTVRSLATLLTQYEDVQQVFVAPEPLQIAEDIREVLDRNRVKFILTDDFDSAVLQADAVYMTRLQDEWDEETGDSSAIDITKYHFTTAHLDMLKEGAIVMHPFPRRKEIAPEVDHDPRAMYWRQMRNGMWIRCALIATTFGADGEIRDR
jgi:aspartate carbamoyltransferase catalytic subunit